MTGSKIAFVVFCAVMATIGIVALCRAGKGKTFEQIIEMIFKSLTL